MPRQTPPAADPRPGRNPGYPETRPRDRDDARQPHPDGEEREDGGLGRSPGDDPDPAGD